MGAGQVKLACQRPLSYATTQVETRSDTGQNRSSRGDGDTICGITAVMGNMNAIMPREWKKKAKKSAILA